MTEKVKIPLNQSPIMKIKSMKSLNTPKNIKNRIKNFKYMINFTPIIEF